MTRLFAAALLAAALGLTGCGQLQTVSTVLTSLATGTIPQTQAEATARSFVHATRDASCVTRMESLGTVAKQNGDSNPGGLPDSYPVYVVEVDAPTAPPLQPMGPDGEAGSSTTWGGSTVVVDAKNGRVLMAVTRPAG